MRAERESQPSGQGVERGLILGVGAFAACFAIVSAYIALLYLPQLGATGQDTLFATVFTASSIAFSVAAYRLLFNRKRRDGGLLSPALVVFGSCLLAALSVILLFVSEARSVWLIGLTILGAIATVAGGPQAVQLAERK